MFMKSSNYKGKNIIVAGVISKEAQEMIENLLKKGAEKVVIADEKEDVLQPLEKKLNSNYPGKVKALIYSPVAAENLTDLISDSLYFLEGKIDLFINNLSGKVERKKETLDKTYFKDKTAVVTGAASGIGLALIEELLTYGAKKVVMADVSKVNLEKHVNRLKKQYPGKVRGIFCDVTVEENVINMLNEAVVFFNGSLDLLINNAGAGLAGHFTMPSNGNRIDNMQVQTNEIWEKAFALNFYGALYGTRAAIPVMQKNGGGQIINVISGIAFYPMPYQSMYSATKAALNGLSLSLRSEYWDENIKISPATPGTTATAIWEENGKSNMPDSAQTPQQSAQTILTGVCHNNRIIFGDIYDEAGSRNCFHVDHQDIPEQYLLNIARARRKGKAIL